MKFVFPTLAYKEKALDFLQAFAALPNELNGVGGLDRYIENESYEAWLEKVQADIDVANIEEPRVPALTYFAVREEDDVIVGMVNARLALNDFLRSEGGHIGYCVHPGERRKGYATEMLKKALVIYAVLGIKEVIVTCDETNEASAKTIQHCNGVLEAAVFSERFGVQIQRYRLATNYTNSKYE